MNEQGNYDRLIQLLGQAIDLAAQYSGGYSERFLGAEEFAAALHNALEQLNAGDKSVIETLWLWFLPTSDWDDLVGWEGVDLGNKIEGLLRMLK
jgi:hypothetical protein